MILACLQLISAAEDMTMANSDGACCSDQSTPLFMSIRCLGEKLSTIYSLVRVRVSESVRDELIDNLLMVFVCLRLIWVEGDTTAIISEQVVASLFHGFVMRYL